MFTTQHLRACVVAAVAASISCHRAAAKGKISDRQLLVATSHQ